MRLAFVDFPASTLPHLGCFHEWRISWFTLSNVLSRLFWEPLYKCLPLLYVDTYSFFFFLFYVVKELACERECSRGEDYRLIKLTIIDYNVGTFCLFIYFYLFTYLYSPCFFFGFFFPQFFSNCSRHNRERKNKMLLWSVEVTMLPASTALIKFMGKLSCLILLVFWAG